MKWLNAIISLVVISGTLYYIALWTGLLDTKGCFKVSLDDYTFYANTYRETNKSYIFKLPDGKTIEAFKGNVKIKIEESDRYCQNLKNASGG